MGFKSSNKDALRQWRATNIERLQTAGIPHDVVSDDRRFWLAVQNGDDHQHTGWDITWITDEQAGLLLALLNEVITEDVGWDLVAALKRRVGAP